MSNRYTWVQWNWHKGIYDLTLAGLIIGYLVVFIGVSSAIYTSENAISPLIMLIRATGTLAVTMLTLILSIGPLARLWPTRFTPLLYNRRHFGVATFFIALIHGGLVLLWYGSFGKINPIAAMLTMNPRYGSFTGFPFEVLGIAALVLLFFLAATSHAFWLKNLTPRVWKGLHMSVYVAYTLVVFHIVLGVVQSERSGVYPALVITGSFGLIGLHLTAGFRERAVDRAGVAADDGWIDVAGVYDIPVDRAKVVKPAEGIPPMFVVRDSAGQTTGYLLTGPKDEPMPTSFYEFIADPVQLTGQVIRRDGALIFRADWETIRRLK